MICKIQGKEEAWGFLYAAIDCGSSVPIFDIDVDLDPSEIPINICKCSCCGHHAGDTIEDVALDNMATNCSRCGARLNHLISVNLAVQDMQVIFRKDN